MEPFSFDLTILSYLQQFARQSLIFDQFMVMISHMNLVKGVVVVAIYYWLWFEQDKWRSLLIASVLGSICAIACNQALVKTLPFRVRPLHDASIDWVHPFDNAQAILKGWSSFPSDHATLYFALAAGIFIVSRWWGLFAFVYAIVVICFPRLYLGLHFFSDIWVGGLLGIGWVFLWTQIPPIRRWSSAPFLSWHAVHPSSFYAVLFIVAYQAATLFSDPRVLGRWLFDIGG